MIDSRMQAMHILLIDSRSEPGRQRLSHALTQTPGLYITEVAAFADAAHLITSEQTHIDVVLIDGAPDNAEHSLALQLQLNRLAPNLPVLLPPAGSAAGLDDQLAAQIGTYAREAMQRARQWQILLQQLTPRLYSLNIDDMLDTCIAELGQLGYSDVILYRYERVWDSDPATTSKQRRVSKWPILRYVRASLPVTETQIDLSAAGHIRRLMDDQDRAVDVDRDQETLKISLPLRPGAQPNTPADRRLGLLVVKHVPQRWQHEIGYLITFAQHVAVAFHNANSYEQVQAYQRTVVEQIRRTNQHILAIDPEADAHTIYDRFARALTEGLNFKRAVISTLDEAADEVVVKGLAGLTEEETLKTRDQRIRHKDFISLHRPEFSKGDLGISYFIPESEYDFDKYQGFILKPVPYDVSETDWRAGHMLRAEVRNSQGKVLGYISMDEQAEGYLPDQATYESLEVFAAQIAVTIESIANQRALQVIKELGDDINSIRTHTALYDTVHERVHDLMYVESLLIGRYDARSRTITIVRRRSTSEEDQQLSKYDLRPDDVGLTGYIVRSRKTLLFSSYAEIQSFMQRHGIAPLGPPARSWMGVPLVVNDDVIGVIALQDYHREQLYDERSLRLLEIVARQLAVAMVRIDLEEARLDDSISAMTAVVQALSGSRVTLRNVEQLILERACALTKADYGMLLKYDEQDNSLVFDIGQFSDPDVQKPELYANFQPGMRLPLEPKPGQQRSLSVQAARLKRPITWPNVHEEPDYFKGIELTISQVSVPLLHPTARHELLGVLTLESRRENAFDTFHEKTLTALGQFAALAFLREEEELRNRSLLLWGLNYLSGQIIRHRYVTDARTLVTRLKTTADRFTELLRVLQGLHVHAAKIQAAPDVDLRQCAPVQLNDAVRAFYQAHETLYAYKGIELEVPIFYLPDDEQVLVNPLGLREALKIIVDNAFEALVREPFGGRIEIRTDRDSAGVLLRVFNSGPMLPPAAVALVTAEQIDWSDGGFSLVKLRQLLSLYGATLRLSQNDAEGVEFAISFPAQPTPSLNTGPEGYHQLVKLQRSIASHSALLFANVVRMRAPELQRNFQQIGGELDRISQMVESLTADVNTNLDQREVLSVPELISDFVRAHHNLQRQQDIPLRYRPGIATEAWIKANRQGLRQVLIILVDNAQQAIEQSQGLQTSPPQITISTAIQDTRAQIRIHNTGSVIAGPIRDQLFKVPIQEDTKRGQGIGLLLCKELVTKYDGTIELSGGYDPVEGVQFTIELPLLPRTAQ